MYDNQKIAFEKWNSQLCCMFKAIYFDAESDKTFKICFKISALDHWMVERKVLRRKNGADLFGRYKSLNNKIISN